MQKMLLLIVLNLFPVFVHSDIDWEDLTEMIYQTPEAYDLTAIGEGGTNANYHLEFNGSHYFVRMAPPDAKLLGADIEIEFKVLQLLCDLHISPQPIYLNRDRKILVMEYIQSDQDVDLLDTPTRLKVLSMLHAIESSNITVSRLHQPYLKVLQLVELAKSLNDPVCSIFINELLPSLKQIDEVLSRIQEKKLCHLDLHHSNILKCDDRIWIIDWEYATMSDPLMTLGSMASIENWNEEQMKTLLDDYLPNSTSENYHTLYLHRIAADIHWAAWCHVQRTLSKLNVPYDLWEESYFNEALKHIRSSKFIEIIDRSRK